jgi:hypothetical protein
MRAITKSINVVCSKETEKDCIVLWSGDNDVSKNNTKKEHIHKHNSYECPT